MSVSNPVIDTARSTKICTVCKEEKPLDEFYNVKRSKDGKSYRCKECDNKAGKAYKELHRDRVKILHRNARDRYRHGIEPEDYERMHTEQNGVCAICLQEAPINVQHQRLVIDHCHTTGKIRGLLCHKCNQALGLFKDNVNYLANAIEYLRKPV